MTQNTWKAYYRPHPRGPEFNLSVIALSERTAKFLATKQLQRTTTHYGAFITRVVRDA